MGTPGHPFHSPMEWNWPLGIEITANRPHFGDALSSFDVTHNFVFSYEYHLPVDRLTHPNRLSRGWSFSGIRQFASGFPVTLTNNGDNSLIGTNPNGVNNSSIVSAFRLVPKAQLTAKYRVGTPPAPGHIFEAHWSLKGGPPLHVHQVEDEWFYVIEGEFVVQVGDERFRFTPEDSILAPRKVPHTYAQVGDGEGC